MRCVKVKVRLPHMKDSSPALFMSTLGLFWIFHIMLGCPFYANKHRKWFGFAFVCLFYLSLCDSCGLWKESDAINPTVSSVFRVVGPSRVSHFWLFIAVWAAQIPGNLIFPIQIWPTCCVALSWTHQISSWPQSERGVRVKIEINRDFWGDGNHKLNCEVLLGRVGVAAHVIFPLSQLSRLLLLHNNLEVKWSLHADVSPWPCLLLLMCFSAQASHTRDVTAEVNWYRILSNSSAVVTIYFLSQWQFFFFFTVKCKNMNFSLKSTLPAFVSL